MGRTLGRERGGALVQDVQIGAVAEDAAAPSPRHLIDDTQPLKVRQRSIDRRRRQKSAARACHIGRITEVAGSLGLTADRRLRRAPV